MERRVRRETLVWRAPFFSVGRGRRACVGGEFAQFSLRLTLAVFVTEFDCRFTPDSDPTTDFFFGVMMPRGLTARLMPRSA
jgi:cytochrome P450